MQTKGALIWDIGTKSGWSVEELELDPPKDGEVLVQLSAAGLCHSDYHYDAGDGFLEFSPLLGGHEGAGTVLEVGKEVTRIKPGQKVITTFMPSCGRCHYCVVGLSNLCDRGAGLMQGKSLDGTNRIHARGKPVGPMTYTGTFSQYIVCPEDSLVVFDDDIPMPVAAIAGCGVPTGFGTAVNIAGVEIGDTVVVVGTGGVGMNAVQGARVAGAQTIVAVDPVAWKRERSFEFGATHTAPSVDEAFDLVQELTKGVMAERVVLTMGVVDGLLIDPILNLVAKAGTLGIGGVSRMDQQVANFSIFPFVMMQKQIRGGLYGGCNPQVDIPMLLNLYRKGILKLDEMITRTYRIEDINEGYKDMEEGRNLRGVVVYD